MKVKFFAYIRDYTRCKETDIEGCCNVEALLKELCARYGSKLEARLFKRGELSDEIIILINGRHIVHLNGVKTELKENDEISIFPVVAGG